MQDLNCTRSLPCTHSLTHCFNGFIFVCHPGELQNVQDVSRAYHLYYSVTPAEECCDIWPKATEKAN